MRKVRAHHRVWLVGVIFAIGSLAILVLTSSQLGAEKGILALGQQRDIPAQLRLDRIKSSLMQSRAELTDAALSTDPGDRVAHLQKSLDARHLADSGWSAYAATPVRLPDEAARRARIARALTTASGTAGQNAGLAIINTPAGSTVSDTAAIVTVTALIDAQMSDLAALERSLQTKMQADRLHEQQALADAQQRGLAAFLLVMLIGSAVTFASVRSVRLQSRTLEGREREREESARRNEFDARLGRALEMAQTEDGALDIVKQALAEALPEKDTAELLLADSSRAHFEQILTTQNETEGCGVASPKDCPAAQGGSTLVFPSNRALDACPHLRSLDGASSALCLPVTVGSQAIGVIHVTAPDEQPPEGPVAYDLSLVARKAGDRVGALRVLADSQSQARTDPLTGLFNRRSIGNQVRDLVASGTPYVVAFGDLDKFKDLNDAHGHETGDRALRLFARVLQDSIRPGDLPARFGGEEFLVVLPNATVESAVIVVERIRERLALALTSATVPVFTASFGIADGGPGTSFDEVVAEADTALYQAKRTGRNRVIVANAVPEDSMSSVEAS